MNLESIKQTTIYFIAFTIIIGLTSTFVAKQFVDDHDLIGLTGKDMTRMQMVLNGADPSEGKSMDTTNKSNKKVQDAHEKTAEEGQDKPQIPTQEHTVQSGDTIYSIGLKYGVPEKEILQANNLTESSLLQLGQTIKIPEKK